MKLVSVSEARADLSEYIKISEKETVLITRNGRPVAMLTAIVDNDDLERLILSHSPRLRAILNAARERIGRGESLSHDEFWAEVEKDS